jgi:hypothetical protein
VRVLISLLAGEAILLIELAIEMVNKEEKEEKEGKEGKEDEGDKQRTA